MPDARQPPWKELPTVEIAGHRVARASRAELADAMAFDCHAARSLSLPPRVVFDVNGHGLSLARTDPAYSDAVDRADVLHADGGFIVTLSRWRSSTPIAERSATTDMIHDLADRAAQEGLGFYLLGGADSINKACAEQLVRKYPGLRIAGRHHGYFDHADLSGIAKDINESNADILWVGLGKPHEQFVALRLAGLVRCGWLITCGGCFNFVTGRYRRAPRWMQDMNLEWVHRMLTRPRQLFWRYLVTTPHALWIALLSPSKSTEVAGLTTERPGGGLPSVEIAGHQVARASRAELAEAMVVDCTAARSGSHPPRLVFSLNGEAISLARTNAQYREALRKADILHADGGFLVTLSRWKSKAPIAERSATTDMIHDCAARAVRQGLSFYLLGATEEVNRACAEELGSMYPGLRIAGRQHGYFDRDDIARIAEDINSSGADIVWIGLGKPNEQLFAVELQQLVKCGWLATCGGCFNFVTGHYQRAPQWMQDLNLEWLHRMITRPRQLFWRYLVTTPHALWLALFSPARSTGE